jgi:hypothetical protein
MTIQCSHASANLHGEEADDQPAGHPEAKELRSQPAEEGDSAGVALSMRSGPEAPIAQGVAPTAWVVPEGGPSERQTRPVQVLVRAPAHLPPFGTGFRVHGLEGLESDQASKVQISGGGSCLEVHWGTIERARLFVSTMIRRPNPGTTGNSAEPGSLGPAPPLVAKTPTPRCMARNWPRMSRFLTLRWMLIRLGPNAIHIIIIGNLISPWSADLLCKLPTVVYGLRMRSERRNLEV